MVLVNVSLTVSVVGLVERTRVDWCEWWRSDEPRGVSTAVSCETRLLQWLRGCIARVCFVVVVSRVLALLMFCPDEPCGESTAVQHGTKLLLVVTQV